MLSSRPVTSFSSMSRCTQPVHMVCFYICSGLLLSFVTLILPVKVCYDLNILFNADILLLSCCFTADRVCRHNPWFLCLTRLHLPKCVYIFLIHWCFSSWQKYSSVQKSLWEKVSVIMQKQLGERLFLLLHRELEGWLAHLVFVKRVTTIWCREPTVFSPRTTRALNFVHLII